jgi:hypothetical protein
MTTIRALDRLAAPTVPRAVTLAVRIVGAALLLAMGAIHLRLWFDGYRDVPWIGPLFLANAVLGALAALAVVLTPNRWLGWVSLLSALLLLGTLGGLLLSLTVGLFGFYESMSAPLVVPTIAVESAGFVVLAGYSIWAAIRPGPGARRGAGRAGR